MMRKIVRCAAAGLVCTLITVGFRSWPRTRIDVVGLDGKTAWPWRWRRSSVGPSSPRTAACATTFEGVALRDVLAQAGVPLGDELRGQGARAASSSPARRDGYQVAYAIAELDAAFTDQVVLIADRRDGTPLLPDTRSAADRRAARQAAGALDPAGQQDRRGTAMPSTEQRAQPPPLPGHPSDARPERSRGERSQG